MPSPPSAISTTRRAAASGRPPGTSHAFRARLDRELIDPAALPSDAAEAEKREAAKDAAAEREKEELLRVLLTFGRGGEKREKGYLLAKT